MIGKTEGMFCGVRDDREPVLRMDEERIRMVTALKHLGVVVDK